MRTLSTEYVEDHLRDALWRDSDAEIAYWLALHESLGLEMRPTPDLLSAALWYASLGLQVFAVQAGSKIPHKGTRGCLDASSDPRMIYAMWHRHAGSNVAIATGHLLDVIDIDGVAGNAALSEWISGADIERPWGDLDVLGVVSTPRAGGRHLYVHHRDALRNAAGSSSGVDVRAAGGYVVAPPSSTSAGRYEWTTLLDATALREQAQACS